MRITVVSLVALSLILSGCGRKVIIKKYDAVPQQEGQALPLDLMAEERALIGSKEMDWGIALSGGGLRSALFSYGVLKGIYDYKPELLRKTDIVSSASGGGYLSYFMFSKYESRLDTSQGFWDVTYSPKATADSVCHLSSRGNFFPYGILLKTDLFKFGKTSRKRYRERIRRTFGEDDSSMTLPATAKLVSRGETPYPIINVTIDSKGVQRSWPQKLMEITPLFYGTSDFQYKNWQSEKLQNWNEAIAVSGSAFGPLKTPVDIRYPDTIQNPTSLWDAGKSENLAAMALIRRGVKNIFADDTISTLSDISSLKGHLTLPFNQGK